MIRNPTPPPAMPLLWCMALLSVVMALAACKPVVDKPSEAGTTQAPSKQSDKAARAVTVLSAATDSVWS